MTGCECKSGFFSLRDCDEAVASMCNACGRGVCTRHLSPASGFTQCLDCHARGAEPQQPQQPGQEGAAASPAAIGEDETFDSDWSYRYRHRYYSAGYMPIYMGHHYSTYYDSYDTRSFDDTGHGGGDVTDEGGGGFGDS